MGSNLSYGHPLYIIVVVCELFFLTDIILNFFTQNTDEAGEPLSERLEVIAYRYFRQLLSPCDRVSSLRRALVN